MMSGFRMHLSIASYAYVLLLIFLFSISAFFPMIKSVSPKLLVFLIISYKWLSLIVVFGAAICLSFEGFTRWSRYKLSHNYRKLNFSLSLAGAIMPYFVLLLGNVAVILSYCIIGFSYLRSPDCISDNATKFYKAVYFPYFLNAGLLLILSICFFLVSFSFGK